MLLRDALVLLAVWLIGVLGVYDIGGAVHVLLLVGGMLVAGLPAAAAPLQDVGDDDDKPKGPSPDDKGEEDKIKLAELDSEFQERVNAAVGRGIPYLLSLQKQDGRWTSMHDTSEHGPFPNGTTALPPALARCAPYRSVTTARRSR